MPTYSVVMGQGVSVANIGVDELSTGSGNPEDRIQSCSAIVLANAMTGAMGLYHYPSGDIRGNPRSQTVIRDMAQDVVPTVAYVCYGIAGNVDLGHPSVMGIGPRPLHPADEFYGELREYLKTLIAVNCPIKLRPARVGYVVASMHAGAVTIVDQAPFFYTNLRNHQTGNYPFGRVYWD